MRASARDVITLALGFGVLPLAWIVWSSPVFRTGFLIIIPMTSILWVPAGLLLLTLWFQDNPMSRLPGIGTLWWRRFHSSRKLATLGFPFVTAAIFLGLLGAALSGLDVTGLGLAGPGERTFFAGLYTLFAELLVAVSWIGQREEYTRTAYVTGGGGMGQSMLKPFPRASPGPQASERQRTTTRSSALLADLVGFSVVAAGVLLMFASSFLK